MPLKVLVIPAFTAMATLALLGISGRKITATTDPRDTLQMDPPVRFYVLDVLGDGVRLTSAAEGVVFDVDSSGTPVKTAWTAAGSDDAFVIVAPQVAGKLNGSRLLGTGMSLPDGRRLVNPDRALLAAQGHDLGPDFRPLDTPENKRRISTLGPEDPVYGAARVWTDRNHDGRADSTELNTFAEAGVRRINSAFRVRYWKDEHGNALGPLGNFATLERGVEVWRDVHIVGFVR